MSSRTVNVLFTFCFFIKSAHFGIIDNSVEHYSFQSDSGDPACNLPANLVSEIAGYQSTVNQIIDEITQGKFKGQTYDSLAELVDYYGPRISCSEQLEKAIDYAVDTMKKDGLENVHTEPAKLKNWVRGYESAKLVLPWSRNMRILGLGNTVPTPRGGIIADVIAVESFEEFENVPEDQVRGKIVVFVPKWQGYKNTAVYRAKSASVASRKGAVAALIRSIAPFSLGTPHTGSQDYDDDVKKIPVACLTIEDAEMILRMHRRGQQVKVNLEMADYSKPDCNSRNTVGELQGSVHKDKSVVVVSGHFDSWDVGVGAMDDGGGVMISWKAVQFLKELNLRPKRTIRTVLWTGEEQGLFGSQQYMEAHKDTEKEEFNLFMESDSGTFDPRGLDLRGTPEASCIMKEVLKLMGPLNTTQFQHGTAGGPDLGWWGDRGFPTSSLINANERYFWYHHTDADSMNVWKSKDTLDRCTALWAAASYVIADLSIDLPKDLD